MSLYASPFDYLISKLKGIFGEQQTQTAQDAAYYASTNDKFRTLRNYEAEVGEVLFHSDSGDRAFRQKTSFRYHLRAPEGTSYSAAEWEVVKFHNLTGQCEYLTGQVFTDYLSPPLADNLEWRVQDSGAYAYYNANEDSGTGWPQGVAMVDSSGNGRNGTYEIGGPKGGAPVFNDVGIDFAMMPYGNGNNNHPNFYHRAETSINTSAWDAVTIMAWVEMDDISTGTVYSGSIVSVAPTTGVPGYFDIYINNANRQILCYGGIENGNTGNVVTSNLHGTGAHQIVITYDSYDGNNGFRVYVDGVFFQKSGDWIATQTARRLRAISGGAKKFCVGGVPGSSDASSWARHNCRVGGVGLWDRALTADEIATLYDAGIAE